MTPTPKPAASPQPGRRGDRCVFKDSPPPHSLGIGGHDTTNAGRRGENRTRVHVLCTALTFIIIDITLTPASKQINNTTTTTATTAMATGTRPVIASQFDDDDSTRPRARVGRSGRM